jgi:hypothetical protein
MEKKGRPMATLTIPDKLFERLQAAAANQRRPVDDLLFEAIELVALPADSPEAKRLTRDEEIQRLREAMGDRIWTDEDVDQLFPWLDENPMTEAEIDEILANLPVLDPPLSQTVIQMRDEERY